MAKLWLQGVVRNGQVVLDVPLDLPDGTVVAVTDHGSDIAGDLEDLYSVAPTVTLTGEMLAELAAVWRKEKSWEEAEKRIRQLQSR